jgi:hypothetical protein
VNVRVWLPLPQVLEHEPQLLHDPTQLTGHEEVEQVWDCTAPLSQPYVAVHDRPPDEAAVDDVNVRVWLPLPQVLEHEPQLAHEPTQLTGHDEVEQVWDCVLPLSPP